VLSSILPKDTFVEQRTLLLGVNLTVILFNSIYSGLLPIFEVLVMEVDALILKNYKGFDKDRIQKSKRQSLPSTKLFRRKQKARKKAKLV